MASLPRKLTRPPRSDRRAWFTTRGTGHPSTSRPAERSRVRVLEPTSGVHGFRRGCSRLARRRATPAMRASSSPRRFAPPGLPIDLGRQWPQTTALQVVFRRRDPDRFGGPPQRIDIGRTPGVIGGYRLDVLSVVILTVGAAELLVTVVPSQPVLRGLKPGFRLAMVQESEQNSARGDRFSR